MKKIIVCIVCCLFTGLSLSGQIKNSKNYTHQAGFTAGTFFGLAPTYRYNFNANAVQVSVLPIFNDGDFRYTTSIGYLRKLASSKYVDLSFVTSVGYSHRAINNISAINMGTQMEFKLSRFLMLETRIGLFASNISEIDDDSSTRVISPGGGISLMYNFVTND